MYVLIIKTVEQGKIGMKMYYFLSIYSFCKQL